MVFRSKKKALSEEDIKLDYGRTWIWTAIDPVSRLLLCHHVGDRTLDECRELFKTLLSRVDNKPLFVSDELSHYKTVIFENFNHTVEFPRTGNPGRPKKPIQVIDSDVDYAVVHKTREKGTIVDVCTKIVFGTEDTIKERLNKTISNKINTAYIERSNLTLRQNDAHLQRKTIKFSKEMDFFKAKLNIVIFHYNFIKTHISLSIKADKRITLRTPALKANIVKNNWTVKYAFMYPILIQ
ncbi:MAG: hypothetical protein KAI79_11970 [Bacteroidales bacterium]|nr:hypothetical protein [Bacteroidales bacterium]